MEPVFAVKAWATNAHLIADVAKLGYLRRGDRILDPTWGYGNFWKIWQPWASCKGELIGSDLNPIKSPIGKARDMRKYPEQDSSFDAVVLDPPYKLNGTPDEKVDERYGIEYPTSWRHRIVLIQQGIFEACRLSRRQVLVKCADQVCSGRIVWQTDLFTDTARQCGFAKVDRFDMIGHYRPQPHKQQKHAYGRGSTLLIFERM